MTDLDVLSFGFLTEVDRNPIAPENQDTNRLCIDDRVIGLDGQRKRPFSRAL